MPFSGMSLVTAMDNFKFGMVASVALRNAEGVIVDFAVSYANRAACQTYGKTPEELRGRIFSQMVGLRRYEFIFKLMCQVVESGQPTAFYDKVAKTSGEGYRCLHIEMAPQDDGVLIVWHELSPFRDEVAVAEFFLKEHSDVSPRLIFFIDSNGQFRFFNKAWLNYRGCALEEELEKSPLRIFNPADLKPFFGALRYDDRYTEPGQVEFRLMGANGQYAWFSAVLLPKFAIDGVYAGTIGYCTDITEKKLFNEHAQKYSAISSSTKLGIFTKNIANVITEWSIGAELLTGYKAEEVIGRTSESFVSVYQREEALLISAQMRNDHSCLHERIEIRKKDGSRMLTSSTFTPLIGANNDVQGSIVIFRDITEEIQAETKARNFSAMLSSADAGILIRDADGIIVEWNAGAQNILGYSRNEVIGQTPEIFVPAESAGEIADIDRRVARGEHITHAEVLRVHKKGHRLYCSASFTPTFDEEGNLANTVIIFHDITEKKQVEEKAKNMAAIFSTADAGIIIKDLYGRILEWNIGATNIMGYEACEVLGNSTEFYAPPDQYENIAEMNNRIRQGEHVLHCEVVRMHKDGRRIHCSSSYTPIRDRGGNITGSLAIFHDISEKKNIELMHKMAEEELQKAYNDMAAILSEIPAPICVVGKADLRILGVNAAFLTMCGAAAPEEMLGSSALNLVRDFEDNGPFKLRETMRDSANMPAHFVKIDGAFIDVEIFASSLVYKDQDAFAVYFIDLTRQQQQAQALRRAVEVAEEASRVKSTFLANMSHEMRTPLNGVIGFAELALDDAGLPDRTRNYLNKIKISADALLDIINEVLDISKIEAGKVELEKIPFTLADVFRHCETISSPKAMEKGILLYFYADSPNLRLLGDPTRLRQVLLNLLSNAIKFTSKGVVKLFSSFEALPDNRYRLQFEVKDSGIGMTPEQLDKIFKPFIQGDDSTTRRYGGTGLGLSITQSLLELMGGALRVESKPGAGSVFSFTLEFEGAPGQDKKSVESALPPSQRPVFEGEVLICEDNEVNQQVICGHLARIGLEPTVAANGQLGVEAVEARRKAGQAPFDLILMDIHMPVMDGLEAADLLRSMGNSTPVIAMTANVISSYKEHYMEHGLMDYLGKPFNSNELWTCLMKYITPLGFISLHETPGAEAQPSGSGLINRAVGLERAAGDAALYQRLQASFLKANRNGLRELRQAVAAGEGKVAHRLAHTLKSIAATIGALPLADAAHALEEALLEPKGQDIQALMDAAETDLAAVQAELAEQIMPDAKRPDSAGKLNHKAALEFLLRLEPLLESGNSACLEMLEEAAALLAPLGEACELLLARMEDFDFAPAYEVLLELKRRLEKHATPKSGSAVS